MKRNILMLIIFVIIGAVLIGNVNLLTVTTTPVWAYKNGCENGECNMQPYLLGNLRLSSGAPTYLKSLEKCQFDRSLEAYPSPSRDCWEVDFVFDNEDFKAKPNEPIMVNQWIEVTWFPSATVLNREQCHTIDKEKICRTVVYDYDWFEPDYQNTFTFRIVDKSFFNTLVDRKHISDTLNEPSVVSYQIDNKLTTINGGAIIKEKSILFIPSSSSRTEFFRISKGTNTYQAEIDTSTLGDKIIEINPFMLVNNQILGKTSELKIFSTSVKKDVRTLPQFRETPIFDAPNVIKESPLNPITSSVIVMVILLIAIGGVLFVKFKK